MKNINFEEYKQLALTTEMKDYKKVADRVGEEEARVLHCVAKIGCESGELLINEMRPVYNDPFSDKKHILFCKKNQLEELGDLYWYFAMASDIFGFKLSNVPNMELNLQSETSQDINRSILELRTELEDLFWGRIMYGKNITNEQIAKVIFDLQDLVFCHYYELVPQALELNIAKLKKRYPDKYSDKSAIERKDKQ